jgi:hypothetical protein
LFGKTTRNEFLLFYVFLEKWIENVVVFRELKDFDVNPWQGNLCWQQKIKTRQNCETVEFSAMLEMSKWLDIRIPFSILFQWNPMNGGFETLGVWSVLIPFFRNGKLKIPISNHLEIPGNRNQRWKLRFVFLSLFSIFLDLLVNLKSKSHCSFTALSEWLFVSKIYYTRRVFYSFKVRERVEGGEEDLEFKLLQTRPENNYPEFNIFLSSPTKNIFIPLGLFSKLF